jgi:hypothetical protein
MQICTWSLKQKVSAKNKLSSILTWNVSVFGVKCLKNMLQSCPCLHCFHTFSPKVKGRNRQPRQCVQTGSGAHPVSIQWVLGVLSPGVKRGRGVMLTTHPHLVPRLRMSGSYTSSSPCASMACSGVTFLLQAVKNLLQVQYQKKQVFREHVPFTEWEMAMQFYSTNRHYYTCQKQVWESVGMTKRVSVLYDSSEIWCYTEMVVECSRLPVPPPQLPC